MLEIIANGSNTYPYQKSTLSDLYRLLETYTLDPVFERYGEFVNRTPCWIDGETARKYSGASVIAGNFLSYSHAFYLITDQEELIPKGTEAFGALPYGEIALILNEEIRRKSEAAEDMQLMDVLTVFGRMYKYFIW